MDFHYNTSGNAIDHQILYDLTNKLKFTSENMDTDFHMISDDDISMRDYTEDNFSVEYEESLVNTDGLRQRLQNTLIPNEEDGDNINIDISESKGENEIKDKRGLDVVESRPKSLLRKILRPESQGYLVGLSRTTHGNENGNENENDSEKGNTEEIDNDAAPIVNFNSMNNVPSYLDKYNDKNVIIHNHFYNIVAGNPEGKFSDHYIYNSDYEDDNAKKINGEYKGIKIFEQVKRSINYSLLIGIIYLIVRQITKDISMEYEKLIIRENFQKEQCRNEYNVNKCDVYGQLPALKNECLEWLICFSEGRTNHFRKIFYSELAMQVLGRLVNEALDSIGKMNRIFLVVVLLVWYFGNFLCGYVKGVAKGKNEQHLRLVELEEKPCNDFNRALIKSC